MTYVFLLMWSLTLLIPFGIVFNLLGGPDAAIATLVVAPGVAVLITWRRPLWRLVKLLNEIAEPIEYQQGKSK